MAGRRVLKWLALGFGVVGGACFVAWSSPASAMAGAPEFTTAPANIDRISSSTAIAPADDISVGFHIQADSATNRAATLYLFDAQASITFSCEPNGAAAGTVSIAIPSGPYDFPAQYSTTNGGWFPTNQWSSHTTYQAAAVPAPDLCASHPLYVLNDGEQYAATLASSDDTADTFHIQFHTAIAGVVSGGSAATDCGNAQQNPSAANGDGQGYCDFVANGAADNLTPEQYGAPTSTPTPGPSPTPVPTGDPASGGPTATGAGRAASASLSTDDLAMAAPVSSGTAWIGDGFGGVGGAAGDGPGSATPAPDPAPSPSTFGIPPADPAPAIAPFPESSAQSGHLPLMWFAVLGIVDALIAVALVAYRRRTYDVPRGD